MLKCLLGLQAYKILIFTLSDFLLLELQSNTCSKPSDISKVHAVIHISAFATQYPSRIQVAKLLQYPAYMHVLLRSTYIQISITTPPPSPAAIALHLAATYLGTYTDSRKFALYTKGTCPFHSICSSVLDCCKNTIVCRMKRSC